ncbi:glycosyltransferase [Pseudomonas segetis]|uniref:Alpha-1,3-rhamnosyltransferase n=1 Tax=Pseudomonas segetis TaxID=298908 RepID=A0A239DN52_9PSED|nr:glycosyltransferase [Pseudomonas segetis]SNS33193.1 alpha-1,3-rhamnosyltransferase [Pseudomonas segetis]
MDKLLESPLVTVIIASYNHAQYIEESIKSVLAQTYPNIELMVIDDGSSDDSVERISALQQQHGFYFKAQQNQGLSRTLNQAIALSKGSLIAPFGSDDIMFPERIALQVAHMATAPEAGICAGNIERIDSQGRVRERQRIRAARRMDFDAVFLKTEPIAPAPTLLFRREALEKVGGFNPEIRLEDLYIELKITQAGYYIDVLQEVLAQYRMHDTNTYKNLRFMIDNVLATYACFSDHPRYPDVCNRFINSMLVRCARTDKKLARELIRRLPVSAWNTKTLRAFGRYLMPA